MEEPQIITAPFPVDKVYSAYDKLIIIPKKVVMDIDSSGYGIPRSSDAVRNFRFGWVGLVKEITISFNDNVIWKSGNLDKVGHVVVSEFTGYNVIPLNIMTFTDVRVHVKGPCKHIFIDYEYVFNKGHLVREAMSHLSLSHDMANGTLIYTGGCAQLYSGEDRYPTHYSIKSGRVHSTLSDDIVRISVYHGDVNLIHRDSDIVKLVESISPPGDSVIYTNPPCKDFWVKVENVEAFKTDVKALIGCDKFNVESVYNVDVVKTREMKRKHLDIIQRGIDAICGNVSTPEEEICSEFSFDNEEMKADHEAYRELTRF
jgi:hypothetical protein